MGCCNSDIVIEKRNMETQTEPVVSFYQSPLTMLACSASDKSIEKNFRPTSHIKQPSSPLITTKQRMTYYGQAHQSPKQEYITIKIQCDVYESNPLVWVRQNETLKFRTFGTWVPDPTLPKCDSKGIPTYTMSDFNYGALVARVLGDDYFGVYDFSVYTSNKEGPLFFKMYSPRFNLNSSGSITVHLYGGEIIDKKELNSRIGWNTKDIYSNISESELPGIEEEIVVDINKMRCNPNLYSVQYVNVDRVKTNKFLLTKKMCIPFEVDMSIRKHVENFFEGYQKTCNKKEILGYLTKIEEDIGMYLHDHGIKKAKIFAKLYDDCLPHKISMKMLQNETLREYIFTKEYLKVSLRLNEFNNKFLLVFIFANDDSN